MHITFYSALKPREEMLANALKEGARIHGDTLETRWTGDYGETLEGDDKKYPGPTKDTDVACCFGVKGRSARVLRDHLAVGRSTLFFDKGYTRSKGEGGHTEYSRISVNGSDPTGYMMEPNRGDKRWQKLNINPRERKVSPGGHILICGSSEKYHAFHGLPPPHEFAAGLVSKLRKMCDRHIVYRPKPSSTQKQVGVIDTDDIDELREALQHYHTLLIRSGGVSGAALSNGDTKMMDALRGCHVCITHGSAAAMEAILNGVPALVLGGSIAKPVAETVLEKIEHPHWAMEATRQRWYCAMSYCQWTTPELRSGEAWADLKAEIIRQKGSKK